MTRGKDLADRTEREPRTQLRDHRDDGQARVAAEPERPIDREVGDAARVVRGPRTRARERDLAEPRRDLAVMRAGPYEDLAAVLVAAGGEARGGPRQEQRQDRAPERELCGPKLALDVVERRGRGGVGQPDDRGHRGLDIGARPRETARRRALVRGVVHV